MVSQTLWSQHIHWVLNVWVHRIKFFWVKKKKKLKQEVKATVALLFQVLWTHFPLGPPGFVLFTVFIFSIKWLFFPWINHHLYSKQNQPSSFNQNMETLRPEGSFRRFWLSIFCELLSLMRPILSVFNYSNQPEEYFSGNYNYCIPLLEVYVGKQLLKPLKSKLLRQ